MARQWKGEREKAATRDKSKDTEIGTETSGFSETERRKTKRRSDG